MAERDLRRIPRFECGSRSAAHGFHLVWPCPSPFHLRGEVSSVIRPEVQSRTAMVDNLGKSSMTRGDYRNTAGIGLGDCHRKSLVACARHDEKARGTEPFHGALRVKPSGEMNTPETEPRTITFEGSPQWTVTRQFERDDVPELRPGSRKELRTFLRRKPSHKEGNRTMLRSRPRIRRNKIRFDDEAVSVKARLDEFSPCKFSAYQEKVDLLYPSAHQAVQNQHAGNR